MPKLVALLPRGDQSAAAAAAALAAIGPKAKPAVPALLQALRASSAGVPNDGLANDSGTLRSACADALGRLDPDAGVTAQMLVEAVRRKDWVTREALAPRLASAKFRDAMGIELTQLASSASDNLVRANARCALRELHLPVPPPAVTRP